MGEATSAGSNRRYRSGAVEIDAMQRAVLIDGTPAKIGARAFDVLLALVERRERVVSKHELMDAVWPKLVVEEGNLLVHVVTLRKLLGARAIATIPGRGYRFVMPIDAVFTYASAEPVQGSGPIRGNLPAAPELFGRAEDLDAVAALLREQPVTTIVGAGGIGKTCMALAAAAIVRIETPDGRWWIELAPITEGARVATTIAAVLGMQLSLSASANDSLISALSGKRLLLILDNCEHLADDIAALIDLLRERAADVRLLVTSQESLKCRDEHVYRLGPLAVPATAQLEEAAQFGAVALFVERAHAAESRFRLDRDNVETVIDVCRRLDGIPLAIELAAARVPLLGVHGLHARLNQVFNVLSGGTRMKLRRHQTLRAALEWSYGLLSADEQAAFRRLGVFAGGFTLELAQDVVADEHIDQWFVLDLLGHLIDKSLVIADGEAELRYRLLETTRAFALEQLAAAGESASMLQRHARAMCALLAATDANCWNLSPSERRRAVQELSNLRAAVEWALSGADHAALGYELLGKGWLVWMHNGVINEGVERMLKLWPPAPHLTPGIEADFCLALARLNGGCPQHDEHWTAARRAESLYRQLGDRERLGDALLLMGTIGLALNHIPEAGQALREAETLIDDAMPLRKQAALASTQGEHHMCLGVPEQAIADFRRQRELYRRANAEFGEYLALGNVGSAELRSGDVDAAIESLRTAVEGLRRINAPYGQEHRLAMLSIALALRGDGDDVLALAHQAFDHLRSLGATSYPMLAAALHHARRDDLRRASLLAGYALSAPAASNKGTLPVCLLAQQRVRDRAEARYPAAAVDTWLHAGERLTADEAASIAFAQAPLDGLCA